MDLPKSEPIIGKTYIADGWVYRDIPHLSGEMWELLMSYIGNEEEHYVTLAYSDTLRDGKLWARRGQLLISPQGIENLKHNCKPS